MCMCACMYARVYVCMYVRVYVCMYVCVCVFISPLLIFLFMLACMYAYIFSSPFDTSTPDKPASIQTFF